MSSPQSLSEADRRIVAAWAADCAERVLVFFETEAPTDGRPRDAIARARAFAHGELDAAKAAGLATPDQPTAISDEISWQLANMSAEVRAALRQLPPVGEDSAGPLGSGLLASGLLGSIVRKIQAAIGSSTPQGGVR
ncbi:putative immunity protein [Arthrobacter sp. NPDC058127]|uniref:putative immunity protein n=1 Tax=Arthrobacter sp. NPDC058127 TaxID=3346351 RepID=UPI0036E897E0